MPLYANAGRLQAQYRYKGHQEVELYKSPGAIDAPDASPCPATVIATQQLATIRRAELSSLAC